MVNQTKIARRAPTPVDWTDSMQVNSTLTKGLYHNSYPGIKLGGSLAYNPIAIPVSLMGFPVPKVEGSDAIQEELNLLVEKMRDQMKDIHIQTHREGTIWIWPKFLKGKLVWEFISDDTVSDIVRDLESGEPIRIQTDEDITLALGDGQTGTVNRKRVFTRQRVTVTYSGKVPAGIRDSTSRNPSGIIPIPFANNADGGETRGHSDYERIVTDLKSYHDVDLAEQTILAKFSPKMVQSVKDVDQFAKNNGYDSASAMFSTLELGKIDLIMNTTDEETKFEYPDRATEALQSSQKMRFHKIVEASGIPEIAWGLKTQGNLASVDENMTMLMNYVKDKQEQKNDQYKRLFDASLVLLGRAFVVDDVAEVEVKWNELDGISAKTRSEIFRNFAEGVSKLTGSASFTKEQLHWLWKENFPSATTEDFEEFEKGLVAMATHAVTVKSTLEEVTDLSGGNIK